MMDLSDYYLQQDQQVIFSRQQASDFAKGIAEDFNPIHSPEAKRFCVPGDLLFALTLHKFGLYQKMEFNFKGMVSDNVALRYKEMESGQYCLADDNDKVYLEVSCAGDKSKSSGLIAQLTQNYVKFSGKTFPHILVPLMRDNNVMVNPKRPLIIYEMMAIDLLSVDLSSAELELTNAELEVNGKRGTAILHFQFSVNGEKVGEGQKRIVLSGLRAFEESAIDQLVLDYNRHKEKFTRS
jgi:hypothetical protein